MRTIYLFALILTVNSIYGQKALIKKADNNYKHLNFWLAKGQYARLVNAHPKDLNYAVMLASCRKNLHENEKALQGLAPFYASNVFSTKEHFTLYAELCLLTKKYSDAEKCYAKLKEFETLQTSVSMDQRLAWKTNAEINSLLLNSTKSDFGGYPYVNGSIVLVSSRGSNVIKRKWAGNGDNFLDLYQFTQDGKIKRLSRKINSKFHEGPLCVHPNGKWVYFTRNNTANGRSKKDKNGIQNLKLYRAEIKPNGIWKNIKELSINSKEYSVGHPTFSGNNLYFSSDMPGGYGGVDLYVGTLNDQGEILNPTNLGSTVNSSGDEVFAWIYEDQILFASNGHPGIGGLDLFATKLSKDGTYLKPKNLGSPLNSNADDFGMLLMSDKKGYFSSNRVGFGSDDIYSFTLKEPIRWTISVKGNLKELTTEQFIPNQTLIVYNTAGEPIDTLETSETGTFELELNEGESVTLKSPEGSYPSASWDYTASNESDQILNLTLENHPTLTINTLVTDKQSGKAIENVNISIVDGNTGKELIAGNTDIQGTVSDVLTGLKKDQNLNLIVTVKKPGYLDKTANLNHLVTTSETINIHELIDLSMGKLEVGGNLADLIDIKPIYFDLGKYDIRKDAALELDKIVSIMNQYPKMVVELGSHTDCRSSKAFNQKLSQNRAKASADYIKTRITTPTRISGVGYGEAKLKVNCPCEGTVKSNCPEEEHAKNRRTEFIIKKTQ